MRLAEHRAQLQLSHLTGREHVVLTGRAATALWAVLRVHLRPGARLLLPANTCYITLWAALQARIIPVLIDTDPDTGAAHPPADGANAALPCHMYGIPAPMPAWQAWGETHAALVIEDAALALGGECESRPCGGYGAAALLSFGLGKIVDIELGGALVTDDARLAAEVERLLADAPLWSESLARMTREWNDLYWALHRHEDSPSHLEALYPALFERYAPLVRYRLPADYWDDLPAALNALSANTTARRERAQVWRSAFSALSHPAIRLLSTHDALWRFPIFVPAPQRADALQALWDCGVDATCWYPALQPMLRALKPGAQPDPTPSAARWSAEVITLPLAQPLSPQLLSRAAHAVSDCLG